MPSSSGRKPHAAPFRLRREIAFALVPPVVAAASASAALWQHLFFADPHPVWRFAAIAVLVAAVAAAIALCFVGPARRLWKPAATVLPAAIIAGAFALVPAFEAFAMVDHGVDVECTAISIHDYTEVVDGETEFKTKYDFMCIGGDPVSLDTYRDEVIELNEERIVVFDPLGRVEPDFGDPSVSHGLSFLALAALFFGGAAVGRLFFADDGTVVAAVTRVFKRIFETPPG